jgi:hypothetical protein
MPLRLREAIASVRRISNNGKLGPDLQAGEPLPLTETPEDRPSARAAAARRPSTPVVPFAVATTLVLLGGAALGFLYSGRELGEAASPTGMAAPSESSVPHTESSAAPVVSRPLPPITEIVRVERLPTPTAPEPAASAPDPASADGLPLPPPPKPAPQSTAGAGPPGLNPIDRAVDALLREADG